jgi:hypothetical protein
VLCNSVDGIAGSARLANWLPLRIPATGVAGFHSFGRTRGPRLTAIADLPTGGDEGLQKSLELRVVGAFGFQGSRYEID